MIYDALIEQAFSNKSLAEDPVSKLPLNAIVSNVENNVFVAADLIVVNKPEQFLLPQSDTKVSKNIADFGLVPEWTAKEEAKFLRLAREKAIGKLSFKSKVEFEKMSETRRRLKNPRTGEEVLLEYQQRMITRDLVGALSKYVQFHKSKDRAR